MSLWVVGALLALGAALRLTRLVTMDTLGWPLRRWAATRGPHGLGAWLSCPWCVGFWITLACVAAAWAAAPCPGLAWWWAVPAQALGTSWLVGLGANLDADDDEGPPPG
jgi:hypothetical protein